MGDANEVQATVVDYFEGWYDADVERVAKSLHPDYMVRWAEDSQFRLEVDVQGEVQTAAPDAIHAHDPTVS
jgi:hypothetical protein